MACMQYRYCPFCKKAKAALQQVLGNNFTVVEVGLVAFAVLSLVTVLGSDKVSNGYCGCSLMRGRMVTLSRTT